MKVPYSLHRLFLRASLLRPGPPAALGPALQKVPLALTLPLATPSIGWSQQGQGDMVIGSIPCSRNPGRRMPCLSSPWPISSACTGSPRSSDSQDSQRGQRAAVCMEVIGRARTWNLSVPLCTSKATYGKGWTQHWEEKGQASDQSLGISSPHTLTFFAGLPWVWLF